MPLARPLSSFCKLQGLKFDFPRALLAVDSREGLENVPREIQLPPLSAPPTVLTGSEAGFDGRGIQRRNTIHLPETHGLGACGAAGWGCI